MVNPGGFAAAQAAAAGAAAFASILRSTARNWHIANVDTAEIIDGDFQLEDGAITQRVGSAYSETYALNRQDPIVQYLHGESDTTSFTAMFFATGAFESVTEKFEKLKSWVRRDDNLRRPPIVLFWVGDGSVISEDSFIESIENISYGNPKYDGSIRSVRFTVNLRRVNEFKLESGEPPETRYARAKAGEYMELLAQQEYNIPLLGVVLSQRHPEIAIVQEGDIIKLPSLEAIRKVPIAPESIALTGLASRKDSPQKALRQFHIDRLNRTFVSHIVPEGV